METRERASERRKKKKTKKIIKISAIAAAGVLIILGLVFAMLMLMNKYSITFSIPADEIIHLEYGDSFTRPEVTAVYSGTIFHKKPEALDVESMGDVDLNTLGTYEISYTAMYKKKIEKTVVTVILEDTKAPVITLVENPDTFTKPGFEYEEEGYTAVDIYDGDLTDQVVREVKEGQVIYTVSDSHGNKASVTRTLVFKDPDAPVLTVNCAAEITLEPFSSFEMPAYSAVDEIDGDVTGNVQVSGSVDTTVLGTYSITYSVQDQSGNTAEQVITVYVADTVPPEMMLDGGDVTIPLGAAYEEPGYAARDAFDGDLTAEVQISSDVDVNTPGTYTVHYSVSDHSGNAAGAARTVVVFAKQAEIVNPGSKVIYLTFDDGPCSETARLLDVLAAYNVKATFFVTAQAAPYLPLLKDIEAQGHTIAVHSYTHDYANIYSSKDAFFSDYEKMNSVINDYLGHGTSILRFPGGSSNTISRHYCNGVMSQIVAEVNARGIKYSDWNVDSYDASTATSAAEVYANVIRGVQKNGDAPSVVLQHDLRGFSVDAVADIITWGLANGYTFLPIEMSSPDVHHEVLN